MSDRITLDLYQHHETHGEKAAFYLSRDGEEKHAKWIPKSISMRVADGRYEIESWKAREAGFLDPRVIGQGRLDF